MPYIIVDLEATCWPAGTPKKKMEIIEIGAVRLTHDRQAVADKFVRFVRPIYYPQLSDFCKELTGITQEQIDNAEPFNLVFPQFLEWIGNGGLRICSWGNYDLRQFETDAKEHNIHLPREFRANHINLKDSFARQRRIKPCGMAQALKKLRIPLEGTHHCGIDDARNIAKIAIKAGLL